MHSPSSPFGVSCIEVEPVNAWTVFRLGDPTRAETIVEAIHEHFSRMTTVDVIWDLSGASVAEMTDVDIEAVLKAAQEHGTKRCDARTVFVCTDQDVFEVVGAYVKKAGKAEMTVDYAVFGTLEEAERWLTCNRKHLCGSGAHEPGSLICERAACRSLRLFQSYRRFKGRL